jgi:hypothetical protein
MNEKLYTIFVFNRFSTIGEIRFSPTVYYLPFIKHDEVEYQCTAIDFEINATLACPMKCEIVSRFAFMKRELIELFSQHNDSSFIQWLARGKGLFSYRTNNYFRFIRILKSMPCLIAKNFGENYVNTHMIGYNENVVKVIEEHLSKKIIN